MKACQPKQKTLTVNVKKVYFDQIKDHTKPYEFRLDNLYWQKRLIGKKYDIFEVRCGYPKNGDKERIIRRKYLGYEKQIIIHEHFGETSVDVFAIKTNGEEIDGR